VLLGGNVIRIALASSLAAALLVTSGLPSQAMTPAVIAMDETGAEPSPEPEPEPSPEPSPDPPPAPTRCEMLINAYTSGGGSLAPDDLRNQGGLGEDVAACLGIDLGPKPPPPNPANRTTCEQVIEAVHRSQGPNPTVEWLASQGGLGVDYANCQGIDLSRSDSPSKPEPSLATDSSEQNASETTSTDGTPQTTLPVQVTFSRTGVDVRNVNVAPQQTRVTLSSPLRRGAVITIKVHRKDPRTGKLVSMDRQVTKVGANGSIRVTVKKRLKAGDVISMATSGKRVATLRLTNPATQTV
jgi:hypothetical protein